MNEYKMSRCWDMPNSNTFSIPSIKRCIGRHLKIGMVSIDPFSNTSRIATHCNDLNPEYNTEYNLDATDFLKKWGDSSIDFGFYDPPYSLRQVSECYKNVGIEVTTETTQSSWRSNHLDQFSRIIKPNGIVMCFGWNSCGIGLKRGFKLIEIMLVSHGGSHNDTIVTVERKLPDLFSVTG